jgi:PAS domain S-box-containing protein
LAKKAKKKEAGGHGTITPAQHSREEKWSAAAAPRSTLMAELRESSGQQAAKRSPRGGKRQLRLATKNVPVAIAYCDTESRYKFVNKHYAERHGFVPEQLLGKQVREVVGEQMWAKFEPYLREGFAGKELEFNLKVDLPYRAGTPQLVHYHYQPEWRDGKVVGLLAAMTNITDFKRPLRYIAVIQDVSACKQADRELQASKDRLQLAFDASQLGWWQYDPLTRIGRGDTRAQEILNIAAAETTIEEFLKTIHPDDVERVWTSMQAAFDPANPKPLSIEYRVRRGDGKVRWVENHGLAYFDGAGRERPAVSLVATLEDITERKEREQREHLLMREASHRARNLLSVVTAIAHQTATRSPDDFIERFSERIRALSANQELHVRDEWHGVDVEELVHAQLAPFADLIGSRIVMFGEKMRLNAAAAQAIGLALHELATNAGKYGALSTKAGRIGIRWWTEGDTFTMSWMERGGPAVSPPRRRGFGTTVLEQMAERSLSGTVDLDYAPSGLTWRLTCPAEESVEPRESSSGAWQCATLGKYLSVARRHIAAGERNVDRQRALVALLDRDGHDSQEAKRLLALFEDLQKLYIARRDQLEKELSEISK